RQQQCSQQESANLPNVHKHPPAVSQCAFVKAHPDASARPAGTCAFAWQHIRTPQPCAGRLSSGVATLYTLGTGAVVSDAYRTTTMLAVDNGQELLLIDCGGDAVQRMKASGLDVRRLRHLFVTHEHADHCAGLPLLLERLWVEGLR